MKKWVLLSVLVFCINAYSQSKKISVSVNSPDFSIQLPANPTTGYDWQVKGIDAAVVQFKGKRYLAPNRNLVGAAGMTLLQFRLKSVDNYPKSTQIQLIYTRPWVKNGQGEIKTYTVSIVQ